MSKDIVRARKLENEIKELRAQHPVGYENTLIRAEVVLRSKKGESQRSIAKNMNLKSKSNVKNWETKYDDEGIKGLMLMNKKPAQNTTRDTSDDEKLLATLKEEIKKLEATDSDKYPNTLIRAKAVKLFLTKNNKETLKTIAQKIGCDPTTVNEWVHIYHNKKIKGLKAIESQPISKSIRDTSDDKNLLVILNEEIKKLETTDSEKYPNTLIRAKAIRDYLSSPDETQAAIGAKIGASQPMIKNWLNIFIANKMDGLKKLESQPLSKPLRDTSNDKKLIAILKKGINKIEAKESRRKRYKNTLIRATALYDYLSNPDKSQADIANEIGSNQTTIKNWLKILTEGGMKGLSEIEENPIYTPKRDTLKDIELLEDFIKELEAKNDKKHEKTLKIAKAILDYLENIGTKTQKQIAENINADEKTFRNWFNKFNSEGIQGLMDKRSTKVNDMAVQPKRARTTNMAKKQSSSSSKKRKMGM